MRTQIFGRTGVDVPVIGQGTWFFEEAREKAAIEALEAGIEAGLNHIDTAELYGAGRVEEIVGRAISGRRDDVFLVSKVLPSNADYDDTIAACERTLERLGTDHLDVYLLHWRGGTPLEETFRAFDELESAGKIRAWGVSNFDVDDLDEAVGVAGEGRIACNQVLYHLGERTIEHGVVPWCHKRDVAVVAYSPLGSGRFPGPRSNGGQVLARISAERGVSPQQVALAFLTRQAGAFAIPKAAQAEHVRDNAGAADIELNDTEMRAIDEAFPPGRSRRLAMI